MLTTILKERLWSTFGKGHTIGMLHLFYFKAFNGFGNSCPFLYCIMFPKYFDLLVHSAIFRDNRLGF